MDETNAGTSDARKIGEEDDDSSSGSDADENTAQPAAKAEPAASSAPVEAPKEATE